MLSRLKVLERAHKGQTFQAHHLRMVLVQVEQGLKMFHGALDVNLRGAGKIAVALAPRHLVNAVKKLEKQFTGHAPILQVEQAAVVRGIYKKVTPSLLDRYQKSWEFYTRPVVEKVKLELAQALLQGDTVDDAVERVAGTDGVFAAERWRAERIVRTELSYSYGVTQQAAIAEMRRRDVPDLQKKLIATFDDRTGDDSKELHGQVREADEPFVWTRVTKKGAETIRYMMPPNRPNDREVVIPWRPDWTDSSITAPDGDGPGDVAPRMPRDLTLVVD